ncbi:MAG: NAD-dependent epimerase/dehydratase family protein [Spirochaetia bacterium]
MERVLITGANGFIGSNLCRYFLDHSYDVCGLVRRTSDLHFLDGLPVTLRQCDLSEPAPIDFPGGIDYVIHAASLVRDSASMEEARRNTYDTTRNLIDQLRERRVALKRFVYISTALVLGHRATDISEENPGRPALGVRPYVNAKVVTEALLLQEFREHGLPVVILRPSDVYGPNDRTSSLRLLKGIEDGWPTVIGSGNRILSFCDVGNLVRACHLACLMRGRDGAAYAVTNGQDITWRQLMSFFQERLDRRQRLYVPLIAAYVIALALQLLHDVIPAVPRRISYYPVSKIGRDTSYDISRTRQELGYEPDQDLERQLESILRWYQGEKSSGRIESMRRRQE